MSVGEQRRGTASAREQAQDRKRDRAQTRWPLLAVVALLGLLLAMTSALLRATPTAPLEDLAIVPSLALDLPLPLLDEPIRCTRAEAASEIATLAGALREEGRVTSPLVLACPRLFDGREVVFVGEVVGDVLRRSGGAWLQLNDDDYALEVGPLGPHRELRGFNSGLAVWVPDGSHEGLGAPGRHGMRGAIVQVEGVLLRADPEAGGGITIRARSLEILLPATSVTEPLHLPLVLTATATAFLALVTTVWSRLRTRRRSL
jgi:hypothetical protein